MITRGEGLVRARKAVATILAEARRGGRGRGSRYEYSRVPVALVEPSLCWARISSGREGGGGGRDDARGRASLRIFLRVKEEVEEGLWAPRVNKQREGMVVLATQVGGRTYLHISSDRLPTGICFWSMRSCARGLLYFFVELTSRRVTRRSFIFGEERGKGKGGRGL